VAGNEAARTPQELARDAIEMANGATSTVQTHRAIVLAIVALAGEVHALGAAGSATVSVRSMKADVLNIGIDELLDSLGPDDAIGSDDYDIDD
jgi:hypothetical protein